MIKEIHVYDMDGTIVCSMHRFKTTPEGKIDLAYWIENEHKAYNDSLLPLASQYQAQLSNPEIYVVIATARVLSQPDLDFINDKLGKPDYIISRNGRNDFRKGADLKITGLNKLLSLKQFANIKKRFFYEDNKDYLYPVAEAHNMKPIFVPSLQGV